MRLTFPRLVAAACIAMAVIGAALAGPPVGTPPLPPSPTVVVPTTAALTAMSTFGMATNARVRKTGYFGNDDMPATDYYLTGAACATNSGAGDGGSEIPSSNPLRCWHISQSPYLYPRVWGVVTGPTDVNGDNAARMNKMLVYASQLGSGAGSYGVIDVNGEGLLYTLGDMASINVTIGLLVHNMQFGPSPAFVPSRTKGVFGIVAGSAVITFRDMFGDMNRMPVYCIYDTQPGLVTFDNVNCRHWTGGGTGGSFAGYANDGGFIHFDGKATADILRVTGQQWIGADPEYSDLTKRGGTNLWWDGQSGGSSGWAVQLQGGYSVMRVEGTSAGALKFVNSYFLLGCAGSTGCTDTAHLGQPQLDPICIDIDVGASGFYFVGSTFSGCKINYLTNSSSPPIISFTSTRFIYGAPSATFSSNYGNAYGNFVNITTTGGATSYSKVQIDTVGDLPTAATTPAILALLTSGGGTWFKPACGSSFSNLTVSTAILTKWAAQNNVFNPTGFCNSMVGSTIGESYGIPVDVSTSGTADKYCGDFVSFTNTAPIVINLPNDTPASCVIEFYKRSAGANTVTLTGYGSSDAGTGAAANLNSVSGGTKVLTTQYISGKFVNFRNANGTTAEWTSACFNAGTC